MFEKYTEKARRAVFFARYVAGHSSAEYITTAHLLIGLAWEGKVQAPGIGSLKHKIPQLCVLLGIPWPLRKASEEQLNTDLPLDHKAKMALAYAAEEAEKNGQIWIDEDHLLQGLVRFPNEACTALEILQLNLATANGPFERHPVDLSDKPMPFSMPVREGPEPPQVAASIDRTRGASMFERYTEQARRAIFFARFEAIHRRAETISTAHLLLGLSWDEDSRAVVVGFLKDKLTDICAAIRISLRPSTEIPYDRNGDIPLAAVLTVGIRSVTAGRLRLEAHSPGP